MLIAPKQIKFPFEFDVSDLLTDELKAKIQPVSAKLREVEKDRRERAKVRRRTKQAAEDQQAAAGPSSQAKPMDVDGSSSAGDSHEELSARDKERKELEALIDPELAADAGANATGMYELIGIVTHKGPSADGGELSWYSVMTTLTSRRL